MSTDPCSAFLISKTESRDPSANMLTLHISVACLACSANLIVLADFGMIHKRVGPCQNHCRPKTERILTQIHVMPCYAMLYHVMLCYTYV